MMELTIAEIAEMFEVSTTKVRGWITTHRLDSFKNNGRREMTVLLDDLRMFVNKYPADYSMQFIQWLNDNHIPHTCISQINTRNRLANTYRNNNCYSSAQCNYIQFIDPDTTTYHESGLPIVNYETLLLRAQLEIGGIRDGRVKIREKDGIYEIYDFDKFL